MDSVMFVGEAWGREEEDAKQPFVGASGRLLHSLRKQAGIPYDVCHFTNVFNHHPPGNDITHFCRHPTDPTLSRRIPGLNAIARGHYVDAYWSGELERLEREVLSASPNVIVALGNTALWALCGTGGIKANRGSPRLSYHNHKVIPTWHPAAVLRNWSLRIVCLMDILKAKRNMSFPEIRTPTRHIITAPTLADITTFHEAAASAPYLVCDIETQGGTITEVGFARSPTHAIVIPFLLRPNRSYWPSLLEERAAWDGVRRLCRLPLVGQNFAYDMKYLWRTMGIPCPNFVGDTMLLHHSLQPEMEKGLAFLASLYTEERSWKYMRAASKEAKKGD